MTGNDSGVMTMNASFTVGQSIHGIYNGSERNGTVVQVLENRIRVELEGGGFRMFRIDQLTILN
jgi:sRNA-binding protein